MKHFRVAKIIPLRFVYCFFTILLCDLSCADPPYPQCSNTSNFIADDLFEKSLNNLLQILPSNGSLSKFYNTSVGTNDTDRVYGLYMCLDFVSQETCQNCIAMASQDILTLCKTSKEAVIWEESCQLRYSNDNFFGKLNTSDNWPLSNKQSISEPEQFRSVVNMTLRNLTRKAAYSSGDMYATGEVGFMDDTVYALVQCTRDLSPDDCNKCLGVATREILDIYYYSIGARLLSRSCYLRYELYAFYEGKTEASSGSSAGNKKGQDSGTKRWKFALAAVVSAGVVVAVFGSFAYYKALNKRNKKRNDETFRQTSLKHFHRDYPKDQDQFPYFDFAYIEAATNNFSDSNKLGEGGFGPVYKGVLRDGREVAIKRLSICSEQGSEEFINEVLLIMKLQHKSLVRLLGFCADGEEKILVYEYMPNSSLDVILFDRKTRARLDWSTRIKIISGIAKGTLYLHEDSRLRIIHRDLKASNILLDRDMNPKISDFGMARIFAGTEGQANTATIVGTYGYMAPEYAMEGLYSVKSDVFSFGVLVLEIITGKRNAGFPQASRAPCLLSYAWHQWHEGQVLELVDPLVADSCNPDEFIRYLHIGLLCVQEDAFDRPTMSSVVVMLKGESTSLCQPKRPAFSTGRFTNRSESGAENSCSVNGLTVSIVMPR